MAVARLRHLDRPITGKAQEKNGFKALMNVNIVVLPVVMIHCGNEDGVSEENAPETGNPGAKHGNPPLGWLQ